jgi:uncharacterized protein YndB with AHSA1/START domain
MTEVRFVETCEAPVEVVFEYLTDYRHVVEYWHGMTTFEPVGEPDRGLGAVYDAVTKLGPATLKSRIRTVAWETNAQLSYEAISGMRSTTTYELAKVDENRTRVTLRIEFQLPGGLLGRTMGQTLEPYIASAAKKTAEGMSRGIASYYAGRRAGTGTRSSSSDI